MYHSLLAVAVMAVAVCAAAVAHDLLDAMIVVVPAHTVLPRAGCAKDNCYNAYMHSLSIASPFCSTYIRSTVTVSIVPTITVINGEATLSTAVSTPTNTILPLSTNAQLSSRCSLNTLPGGGPATPLSSRLSSACSCISIVPITVTTTVVSPVIVPVTFTACSQFPSPYTPAPGKTYQLTCGVTNEIDFPSAGYTITENVANFSLCLGLCIANDDCQGIAYYTVNGVKYYCTQFNYSNPNGLLSSGVGGGPSKNVARRS